MQNQKLSPAQRAMYFANATRKYEQMLPSQAFVENQTISFQLPKTRFLSKIYLIMKGSFKVTHASKTSYTKSVFDKHNLVKRVRMSINNGFNPFDISGSMLNLYNKMNKFAVPTADNFSLDVLGNVVSSGGTVNTVSNVYELPITINERDPIGLLLLQNEQSIVSLNVDCGSIKDLMTDTDITISDINITITPVIETFSIPQVPDAVPDYSIVKLVNEQTEHIVNTSEMTVKVPVGLTYRKLGLYLASDTAKTAITHDKLSYFKFVFNQADTPVYVPADQVAYKNKVDYAGSIPVGAYLFDLSSQGIANLGGGRDYIDTERLTECWVTLGFNGLSGSTNYVTMFSEKLAKLM
jgi:hypothetical protein